MITLGVLAKDKITGFKGIATARIEYLNGCVQYALKPPVDKDGKSRDSEWFDESQVEIINQGILIKKKDTGGPIPDKHSGEYTG
jgi:hypothetical protein